MERAVDDLKRTHFRPALFDRVAFVPVWRSNLKSEYKEHALRQMLHFEDVNDGFVRTMPLLHLCEECRRQTGTELFKSGKMHLTAPGMQFARIRILNWAVQHGCAVVLCIGWNAKNPGDEYELQARFIKNLGERIARSPESDVFGCMN